MAFDFKDISKLAGKVIGGLDKDGDGIDMGDITSALKGAGGLDIDGLDLDSITGAIKGFGKLKNLAPTDDKVQSKVSDLKGLIEKNVSGGSEDILKKIAGAVTNVDIKEKIDGIGGSGTGDFVKKAIEAFVKK
jgi:hypothetical protein